MAWIAAAVGSGVLLAAAVWLWGLRGDRGEPEGSIVESPARAEPPAASSTVFDPVKHLDGYEDAFIADWNDLYSFEPFEEAKSKLITAARLAGMRDAWARERERVAKERRRLESDPMALHLHRLERRFVNHRFFPKVEYTRSFTSLPFAFFIQKPLKPDRGYEERITAKFVPWLREMERLFRETYVDPLGLRRHEAAPCYAFAILATRGLYEDYARAVKAPFLLQSEAHYNTDLRLAVTYEELIPFDEDEERRSSLLHEFIHALQHAYSSGEGMVAPLWFVEGLAQYWTEGRTRKLEDIGKPEIDPGRLKWFVQLLRSADAAFAAPIEDLVSADSYAGIYEEAVERLGESARGHRAEELWPEIMNAFYSQSYLFMHFLHRAEGGKHLPGLLRYTRDVMGGKSGWSVFLEAFEGEDLTGGFLAFLGERYAERWPGEIEGRLALAGPKPKSAPPGGEPAPRSEKKTKAPRPPRVDPAGLRLGSDERDAILGMSMSLASEGRLEEALSRLRAAGAGGKSPPAARIGREIERIEEAARLRDRVLESAARSKAVLEVAATRGRIEKFDADRKVIHLNVAGKVKELGVADLTPENLRKAAEADERLTGSRSWMGAYLLLLSGQPPATLLEHRYLKDRASSRARALRDDIAADFERIRALGEPARILDDLSRRRPPAEEDAAGAADALSRLRALAERHGKAELVQRRRGELRAYAEALLDRTFDPMQPDCLGIHGKLRRGERDAIVLTYEFEDPREGEDFLPEPKYLAEWRREMERGEGLPGLKPESSSFVVEDGALAGIGATSCRFLLPFAAPFRVTYSASGSDAGPAKGRAEEKLVFIVGVCDDGRGMGVRCNLQGDVLALSDGRVEQLEGTIQEMLLGQSYHYEIRHDGKAIEFRAGSGSVKLEHPETFNRGSLVLWIHAKLEVRITRLEIEATLDAESLRAARRRWIERQLEGLF